MINAGTMLYRGADAVFSNSAELLNTGSLTFNSPATLYAGTADAGDILNTGSLIFAASPTLHVPLINRGLISLTGRNTLTLDAAFSQDYPSARFEALEGGSIVKSEGQLNFAMGTVSAVNVKATALLFGGLWQLNGLDAKIDGNIVMAPTSTLSSTGGVVRSPSGTIFLAGASDFTGVKGDILRAQQIYNNFDSSTVDLNATSTSLVALGSGSGFKSSTEQTSFSTWSSAASVQQAPVYVPSAFGSVVAPYSSPSLASSSFAPAVSGDPAYIQRSSSSTAESGIDRAGAGASSSSQIRTASLDTRGIQRVGKVLGLDRTGIEALTITFIVLTVISTSSTAVFARLYWKTKHAVNSNKTSVM